MKQLFLEKKHRYLTNYFLFISLFVCVCVNREFLCKPRALQQIPSS